MMLRALLPVAGTQQGEVKSRTPRCFRSQSARGSSAGEPAGFSSAGHRFRADPDQENRHAGGFRSQRKAAACGEIISAGLAPEFDDDCTESRASRSFKPGLKGGRHIARSDKQEACGIKSQFRPSRRVRRARLARERLMPNPEHCSFPAPGTEHHRQRSKAHAIRFGRGINFMQKPALERETARFDGRMFGLFLEGD